MSLLVKGATSKTKIKWAAAQDAAGYRFTLRNIFISQARVLTEPLATPADFSFTPTDASVACSWSPVPNATGYRVTLAEAEKPQFQMMAEMAETSYTFEGLEKDTEYLFTVQALYSENPAMNSPVSEPQSVRTLQRVDPLPTPTVKIFRSERGLIVAEWTNDSELEKTREFDIELRDASGKVLRSYTDATYTYVQYENRFTFAKVEESTTYTVAVRQLSSDQTLYKDSEWGTVTLTSAAAPDMTDVLFYEDFNDLWWSGDYVNLSYGPQLKSFNNALSAYTVEDDDFAAACTVTYPAGNMTDVGGPTTANDAYRNAYWSPWSEEWSLLAAAGKALGYLTKVYPCTGCVKYGTEPDGYVNYVKGANVAGFMKVAKAMMAQGIV